MAQPGVVVVTAEAASALPVDGSWARDELPPLSRRGVAQPVGLFAVDRAPRD